MDRDFAPSPWEPLPEDDTAKPRQSWRSAALRVVALFVILPAVAFGGYYLAVSGASGTVTFGNDAVGCAIGAQSGAFRVGDPVFAAVILEHGVLPGELLKVRLLHGADILSELDLVIDRTGTCETRLIDDGKLAPGRYRVTYSADEELLAEGEFEVIAAPGTAATSEA